MKRPGFGIILIAAAAVIAVAIVLLSSGTARRAVASAFSPTASGPKVAGAATLTGAAATGAEAAGAAEIRLADAWKTLDHGDLKSLVANLRAAGFPPEVVRAVVAAMLHEQFAARRAQILGDQKVPPYWQTGSLNNFYSSPQMAALRQLARDEQDALRQLLGPDSAMSDMARVYQQRMFGDLAPEKADAMQRILADYSDLRSQVYADTGNGRVMLPSDRAKLALLDQEQHDDIAALLTPDELQQYDLRSSNTAMQLRSQLAYFNPTQQEFDSLYALQSQFDQKYNSMATAGLMLTPDQVRQRQADQQQLQDQIKAALGDQRYVQYQQSTDPGYLAASRIASTMQLPAENAAATWTLEQNTEQQAKALMSNRGLPSGQRIEALAALDAQANQQLTALLTQPGLDAYKQTMGGNWLRNLDQTAHFRPPPAAPPASTVGH
ncbi:MAG TPA: hypothetical protein VMF63_07710 [Opitutaceae bacterium]|nr:hypothetical protein [Opitutaceae bacterium]